MVSVRGRSEVKAYLKQLPEEIERKLLRGAGRAGGKVIAEEAKARVTSDKVRDDVVVRVRSRDDRIVVRITVKPGFATSIGTWLEWGTDPHFISVDDSQREGRSVRRINQIVREGSLVIAGNFVGSTVWHPGARPHPFLRPALDAKEGEAIAAAQGYINARVSRAGIRGTAEADDE